MKSNSKATSKSTLVFRRPAARWQDALPIGNGELGAMLYGCVHDEQVLLNHCGLWYHKSKPHLINISDKLAEVRGLLDDGRYKEALDLYPAEVAKRGGRLERPDPYQPVADIRITQQPHGAFRGYRRGLDLAEGLAWVIWSDDLASYRREAFCSRTDDLIALRFTSDKRDSLSLSLRLEQHDLHGHRVIPGFGAPTALPVVEYTTSVDGEYSICQGRYDTGDCFTAIGRVIVEDGRASSDKGYCRVDNATSLTLLVKIVIGETSDAVTERLKSELASVDDSFDTLLVRHSAVHGELFNRVTLELPEQDMGRSIDELMMEAYDGNLPTVLVKHMYEFGRYLLISASGRAMWPSNLQGLWNGDYAPAWAADIHSDENIQMNYWQALPGNLPEMALSLHSYYERFMDDYRRNARNFYGCRGILVPIAQSTNGQMYPNSWCYWTAAAGWIGSHFYDYFLFTGDMEFLRDHVIPWLKETALFYEDFLYEGPGGRYVFSPSISPENKPANIGMTIATINATMDVAICREVLENLCHSCELLNVESEGIARWRAMLRKLPEYRINEDGALREWLHPAFKDNYNHRHQSHVYGVFPGFSITKENNPAIYEACRVAIEKRQTVGQTAQMGWSLAHMANVYARLGYGCKALECLESVIRSSTCPSLLTRLNDPAGMGLTEHRLDPPFQIDANMGFAAAVQEMLISSAPGIIRLLPALPPRWANGSIGCLLTRAGVAISLKWDTQRHCVKANMTSRTVQTVRCCLPHAITACTASDSGVTISLDPHGDNWRSITLPAGKCVSILFTATKVADFPNQVK